jgi:hypothetical protein
MQHWTAAEWICPEKFANGNSNWCAKVRNSQQFGCIWTHGAYFLDFNESVVTRKVASVDAGVEYRAASSVP